MHQTDDDDRGRQAVVLAQFPGRQHGTAHCVERIVVALALRARIALHRFLTGLAVHAWRFIIVINAPGAASLANTASMVARASGTSRRWMRLIPPPVTAKLWMNSRLGIGSVSVGQQP